MTQTPFQYRVKPWMDVCFGPLISGDKVERNHRFLEEALELVQSTGCTQSEAHQLVDYVYGRDIGDPAQEVGGVMVTLAALCLAQGMSMHDAGDVELARIWTKVEKIRAKQAAKPKHSPLPEALGADLGTVIVPRQLTAEDGYKYALSAEFFEEIDVTNPEYDEDDEDSDEVLHIRVPIQWTTIKEIHRAVVKHALSAIASETQASGKTDGPNL